MLEEALRTNWRTVLMVLVGLAVEAGCLRSAPLAQHDSAQAPHELKQGEISPSPRSLTSENRLFEYIRVSETGPAWSIVHVEGCPLVFTRQVFGTGASDPEKQIAVAWQELGSVLRKADSGPERIVRLNIVAEDDETLAKAFGFFERAIQPGMRPAISYVVGALPDRAKIALDAVGVPHGSVETVTRWDSAHASDINQTDAVTVPSGGLVFFSGQPDKSALPQAAANSLKALLETAQQLGIASGDVVQLRVFLQPVTSAHQVMDEIKKAFSKKSIPPVVYTEWLASAPLEIEMIARLPEKAVAGTEPLRFYNPPGVKPSPVFTPVVLVHTDRLFFLPTLVANQSGNANAQATDVFSRLSELLGTCGSDWRHVAKATYYVVDKEASSAIDALRPQHLDPERPPAASKVTVPGVGRKDRTLSVDLIAVPVEPPPSPQSGE